MQKIKIIAVGSLTPEMKTVFNQYAKNIAHFVNFSVVEIKEFSEEKNIEVKKQKETKLILEKIQNDSYVILLSLKGNANIDSLVFSNIINTHDDITFIVGGSDGVIEDELKTNQKICFSKLTFPHQLFRVMLTEQIYRSLMIINNKKYHK